MKPLPLLDFWQKPANAGAPVALFATTFALDSDFFEQNCLARFLEVSSINEDTGSADDIVAGIELHELLQKTRVTVLVDRSAPVERTSLLWDLLSCKVEHALLHSKVSVLLWENATRVILGSMNLTSAGYRRQIELGLAADLGPGCLFPQDTLRGIKRELSSYLELVPGYSARLPVFTRASETLRMFQTRIDEQIDSKPKVRIAFAPTNPTEKPLDQLKKVWGGGQPLTATHLSPFWNKKDTTVLKAVKELLTGRPTSKRSHRVAVVLGPQGQISFPSDLAKQVDEVKELKPLDTEVRTLHAKCLLLEGSSWVAALVGSSNHTQSGLGYAKHPHREMNVWLGASKASKEGKALLGLIRLANRVTADADEIEPSDEDEINLPSLPACFGLCRISRLGDRSAWALSLNIDKDAGSPERWSIRLPDGTLVLTHQQWEKQGAPAYLQIPINQPSLPMCVLVRWDNCETPWAVIADDRYEIPPGPALTSLRAHQLLQALATGRTLGDTVREMNEPVNERTCKNLGTDIDPLRRFEIPGALLRRGRELAASLSAMQQRLEGQAMTPETLGARLFGPLGPVFVATKVAEACEAQEQPRAEALFTVAEITLTVGRIDWKRVLVHIDESLGLELVNKALVQLKNIRNRLGSKPKNMATYADCSIQEVKRWLKA